MKTLVLIISLLLSLSIAAQDFQVSSMNGYSVDIPAFDIANGNVYLVYGTNYKFYRFPVDGPPAPIPDPIIPDPSNWGPYNTEITYSSLDKLISLYIDYKSNQFELRSVQSLDEGTNWSNPAVIDIVEIGSSISLRVDLPKIIVSEKGTTYLTWFNYRNSADTAAVYIMPYGGNKRRVDLPGGSHYEYCYSIFIRTVNNVDKIYIVYSHDYKYFLRVSEDEGQTFSPPTVIADIGFGFINYQDFSHILIDSNGKLYAAYQYFNSGGTKLVSSTDDGVTWSAPVTIDNEGHHYVGLKITPDNKLIKYYVTNGDLYVTSSLNGELWASPAKVNTSTGTVTGDFGYPSYVNAEVIDNDFIAFAWIDNRTGHDEIFYSKSSIPLPPAVSVKDDIAVNRFSLDQNYPNPFNPVTKIKYSVPEEGNVSIKIYDVLGKEVSTLINERLSEGSYEIEFNGSALTSGVYYYRLESAGKTEIKKMVLLK